MFRSTKTAKCFQESATTSAPTTTLQSQKNWRSAKICLRRALLYVYLLTIEYYANAGSGSDYEDISISIYDETGSNDSATINITTESITGEAPRGNMSITERTYYACLTDEVQYNLEDGVWKEAYAQRGIESHSFTSTIVKGENEADDGWYYIMQCVVCGKSDDKTSR